MLSYITTRTQVKRTDKTSVEIYYDKNIKRTDKTSIELYYDKNIVKEQTRQVLSYITTRT